MNRARLVVVSAALVVMSACASVRDAVVVAPAARPAPAPIERERSTTSRPTVAPTTTSPPPTAPASTVATVPARLEELPARAANVPVGIAIEDARIFGPVVPVGVAANGELDIPPVANTVGWYHYGPSPGEGGSAVLAGHVDWRGQLGVFFTLRNVEVGDVVSVGYADGSLRRFTVIDRHLILKTELPVSDVFTRRGPPRLVLITCGGEFDRSRHRYFSNVVVVAEPLP